MKQLDLFSKQFLGNYILKIAFFFLFTFSTTFLFAQKNFTEGYIVKNSKDTIRGFIDDKEWQKNPSIIEFKEQLSSNAITYTLENIVAFYVGKKLYEKHTVRIDKTPIDVDKLKQNIELQIVKETLFLKVIVKSTVNLYFYQDESNKRHFFFRKEEGDTQELQVRRRYNPTTSNLETQNIYIGQLSSLLASCDAMKEQIKSTKYTQTSLQKLIVNYSKCQKQVITYQSPISKLVLKAGVFVGLSANSFDFPTVPDFQNIKTSISPTIGLNLDVILPLLRGKWSINNEVIFKYYNSSNDKNSFNISYIGLNNMVRYRFYNQGNMSIFVNAGISNAYILNEEETLFFPKNGNKPRNHEQGLLGGIGINMKKLSGELRYASTNGFSPFYNIKSPINSFSLLLSYNF